MLMVLAQRRKQTRIVPDLPCLYVQQYYEYNTRLITFILLIGILTAPLPIFFLITARRANIHIVHCDMHDDDTPCDFPTIGILCKVFGMKKNRTMHTVG